MALSYSHSMLLMVNSCFDLHAKSLWAHSKTNQYSSTSPQQWLHWQSAMLLAMVFKGCVIPQHSTNGAMNFCASPLQHIAYFAVILEGEQSGASTRFVPRSPYFILVSLLAHMKGRGNTVLTITTRWMGHLQSEWTTHHFLRRFVPSLTQFSTNGLLSGL